MTSSLVGSEMCIRDRVTGIQMQGSSSLRNRPTGMSVYNMKFLEDWDVKYCLLYTSDAADDM
eukprot:7576504-Prorocentrum_lima.AAC.1